jgi:hypothetical protein
MEKMKLRLVSAIVAVSSKENPGPADDISGHDCAGRIDQVVIRLSQIGDRPLPTTW